MNTSIFQDESGNGRDPAVSFESLPRLAQAEADYFCERCGYNLHGQPVRRDPGTAILLMRCPECGTFHPAVGASSAARLWVARWARAMLTVWVFVAYSGIATVVILHSGLMEAGLTLIQQASIRTPIDWSRVYLIAGGVSAASAAMGFAASGLSAMIFPHWKRWSLVVAALAWPVMSATATTVWVNQLQLAYRSVGIGYILLFAGAFAAGGLVGAGVGHALARLIVRIVVPPPARQAFTHLWGQHREV